MLDLKKAPCDTSTSGAHRREIPMITKSLSLALYGSSVRGVFGKWRGAGKEPWERQRACFLACAGFTAPFQGVRSTANQQAAIVKHGSTPHADGDNPYVGLLTSHPESSISIPSTSGHG